jgi:hypothetical protein
MMRTAILVAALLLLPIAAAAQVAPGTRTITLTGSAVNRVPASLARVTLGLMSNDRQPIYSAQTIQPVIDALIKAGADPASVRVPLSLSTSGNWSAASISAAFSQPTAAVVQDAIKSAETVVGSMKDTTLSGVWLALTASNCEAAENAARIQAISQARDSAQSIASGFNVHLGAVLSVHSLDPIPADGSCSAQYTVGQYSGGNFEGPLAPDDFVSVPVRSNLMVIYAIK